MSNCSNYNEEMAQLFKELNLDGFELRELTEEEKAKPEDWIKMADNLTLKDAETTNMIRLSNMYAKESSICQNNKKERISIGVIGHVDRGKTTITKVIDDCLKKREYDSINLQPYSNQIVEMLKNGTNESGVSIDDPKDRWPEALKLLDKGTEDVNLVKNQTNLMYPYTKEKFESELNRIISDAEYNQNLKLKLSLKQQIKFK